MTVEVWVNRSCYICGSEIDGIVWNNITVPTEWLCERCDWMEDAEDV